MLRIHTVDTLGTEHLIQPGQSDRGAYSLPGENRAPTLRRGLDDTQHALLLRERQHAAVSALGQLALSERDLDLLFERAAVVVRETLETDFSKVLEFEPDRGQLLVRAGDGWPEGVVGNVEVPAGSESHGGYTMRVRRPVVVTDIARETRFEMAPLLHEYGVVSGAAVVIGAEGPAPFGVLEADMRTPRTFSDEDLDFLQSVANVLAASVEREQHERELEEFIFLVSHELRNPLTSVVGFARRLHRRAVAQQRDEEEIEELDLIREESLRMARTLELLLDMARLDRRDAADVVHEPVALMQLVRQTMAVARERFPSVEFRLTDDGIDAGVDSDPDRLGRILANLMDNAAKYSVLRREVDVRVTEAGAAIEVGVRDACGGIADDDIERLFTRFFRGETPGRAKGLGVGLYVSRRLADAIDATIHVANVGDGCEFTLRIPRAD